MSNPLTDEQIEKRAKRRVDLKMGFYTHALVYVCVNAGLFVLNQYHGDTRWHTLPLFGWGIGLVIHGVVTYLNLSGEGFRERMMADEVDKLKSRR